eukprot:scaffold2148_cov137-Isochrysis_galbana.AAC.4
MAQPPTCKNGRVGSWGPCGGCRAACTLWAGCMKKKNQNREVSFRPGWSVGCRVVGSQDPTYGVRPYVCHTPYVGSYSA